MPNRYLILASNQGSADYLIECFERHQSITYGNHQSQKVKNLVRISNSIYNDKITKKYTLDHLANISDKKDNKASAGDSQLRKQVLDPNKCKIVVVPISSIKNQGYGKSVLDIYF